MARPMVAGLLPAEVVAIEVLQPNRGADQRGDANLAEAVAEGAILAQITRLVLNGLGDQGLEEVSAAAVPVEAAERQLQFRDQGRKAEAQPCGRPSAAYLRVIGRATPDQRPPPRSPWRRFQPARAAPSWRTGRRRPARGRRAARLRASRLSKSASMNTIDSKPSWRASEATSSRATRPRIAHPRPRRRVRVARPRTAAVNMRRTTTSRSRGPSRRRRGLLSDPCTSRPSSTWWAHDRRTCARSSAKPSQGSFGRERHRG